MDKCEHTNGWYWKDLVHGEDGDTFVKACWDCDEELLYETTSEGITLIGGDALEPGISPLTYE